MRLPIYQLDAFTSRLFAGNPAAVVPLEGEWPPDATLQAIAAENNLAETAYFIRRGEEWELRWFTPAVEIDLCGHATLASAAVIFRHIEPERQRAVFRTRKAGALVVTRQGEELALDLPSRPPTKLANPPLDALEAALGRRPVEALAARDWLCLFEATEDVHNLRPDFTAIAKLDTFGLICTAPGVGEFDFVSRFFAPAKGVDEDPVTGSAHSTLVPFWAERLGRTHLRASQVSKRGGELTCDLQGDRVVLAGRVAHYLDGWITV